MVQIVGPRPRHEAYHPAIARHGDLALELLPESIAAQCLG
jgi:hypothetical protein